MDETLCPVSLSIEGVLVGEVWIVFQKICLQCLQTCAQVFFFLIVTPIAYGNLTIDTPIVIVRAKVIVIIASPSLLCWVVGG
jgi:hypothetical protein